MRNCRLGTGLFPELGHFFHGWRVGVSPVGFDSIYGLNCLEEVGSGYQFSLQPRRAGRFLQLVSLEPRQALHINGVCCSAGPASLAAIVIRENHSAERQSGEAMAMIPGSCSSRLIQQSQGIAVAHVSYHVILNDVVEALGGSSPSYSFRMLDGLYVATGFVIVPLAGQIDDLALLEATGLASIVAAERDFGVAVKYFNFSSLEVVRNEMEDLRRINHMLRSGWVQLLDDLEMLQKTLEEITIDDASGSPRNSIAVLAHGAAVWAEENVWDGTAALEKLSRDFMDEN